MMQFKIPGSNLKRRVANKCLNICELVEVVKRNKYRPITFPAVLLILSVREKSLDRQKCINVNNCLTVCDQVEELERIRTVSSLFVLF